LIILLFPKFVSIPPYSDYKKLSYNQINPKQTLFVFKSGRTQGFCLAEGGVVLSSHHSLLPGSPFKISIQIESFSEPKSAQDWLFPLSLVSISEIVIFWKHVDRRWAFIRRNDGCAGPPTEGRELLGTNINQVLSG